MTARREEAQDCKDWWAKNNLLSSSAGDGLLWSDALCGYRRVDFHSTEGEGWCKGAESWADPREHWVLCRACLWQSCRANGSECRRVREAAWHNCPGRNATPYCWQLHQPDVTGREFLLSQPARALHVEAWNIWVFLRFWYWLRNLFFNLISSPAVPHQYPPQAQCLLWHQQKTRRNQDHAHSPLQSRAAQRCLQSAPELNITIYVPPSLDRTSIRKIRHGFSCLLSLSSA